MMGQLSPTTWDSTMMMITSSTWMRLDWMKVDGLDVALDDTGDDMTRTGLDEDGTADA
jgi:hypothetical protein